MSDNSKKITVLLADPDPRVRAEMSTILRREADLRLVAEVGDGESLVEAARRVAPDVIVSGLSSNGSGPLPVVRELISQVPQARVLVTSLCNDSRYVARAVHLGASGYLLKDSASEELADAVRAVAADRLFVSVGIVGIEKPEWVRPKELQS